MFNIKKILEQANKIKAKSEQLKQTLSTIEIEGKAGGDFIIIKGLASGNITSVTISDELWNLKDKEMMQAMILGAVNNFLATQKEKIEELSREQMGDLDIPDIFNSFIK